VPQPPVLDGALECNRSQQEPTGAKRRRSSIGTGSVVVDLTQNQEEHHHPRPQPHLQPSSSNQEQQQAQGQRQLPQEQQEVPQEPGALSSPGPAAGTPAGVEPKEVVEEEEEDHNPQGSGFGCSGAVPAGTSSGTPATTSSGKQQQQQQQTGSNTQQREGGQHGDQDASASETKSALQDRPALLADVQQQVQDIRAALCQELLLPYPFQQQEGGKADEQDHVASGSGLMPVPLQAHEVRTRCFQLSISILNFCTLAQIYAHVLSQPSTGEIDCCSHLALHQAG